MITTEHLLEVVKSEIFSTSLDENKIQPLKNTVGLNGWQSL